MRLRKLCYAQCHVVQHWKMASNICTVLETKASTESNHKRRNILVVKGIADMGLKDIHAKATVITIASFDVGCLKKIS